MKLTSKHFDNFKKECLYWQDRFELHNWELHFRWAKKNTNRRAGINHNLNGYIATIILSEEWGNYQKITDEDIKIAAKHEMIHLLIGRLVYNGETRYITIDDLEESQEELVRKLEYIIK